MLQNIRNGKFEESKNVFIENVCNMNYKLFYKLKEGRKNTENRRIM